MSFFRGDVQPYYQQLQQPEEPMKQRWGTPETSSKPTARVTVRVTVGAPFSYGYVGGAFTVQYRRRGWFARWRYLPQFITTEGHHYDQESTGYWTCWNTHDRDDAEAIAAYIASGGLDEYLYEQQARETAHQAAIRHLRNKPILPSSYGKVW